MNYPVSFTLVSGNRKTGPIPNSVTHSKTCPDSCSFKSGNVCYPHFSPLGFLWKSLETNGLTSSGRQYKVLKWEEFCNKVDDLPKRTLWRHNTAGDLPGENEEIDVKAFAKLVDANRGKKGFTYTHKPVGYEGVGLVNASAIYAANKSGFTVNLSADSLRQADYLSSLNIAPVVVVLPTDSPKQLKTPEGRHVIVCPAEYANVQCNTCKLCTKDRKAIVGFRAHGRRQKEVNRRLKVLQ
jgi:hypothetical protein